MFIVLPLWADDEPVIPHTPEGVFMKKTVTQAPNIDNQYVITLESYVTGTTVITQDVKPCDIILLVDMSTSMTANNVTVEKTPATKTPVAQGTQLSTSNTYVTVINGQEVFLKMFYRSGYGYYVRYKSGSEPTSRSDGYQYGSSQRYSSPYTVSATDNISLYTPGTTESVTRLEALKRASKQFVESILANSPTEGKHKLSIIGFHSSAVEISGSGFTEVTDASASNLKTAIDNIFVPVTRTYTGTDVNKWKYTNPAVGFYKATQLFDQVYDDGRKKVVVFFTDGVPAEQGTDNFNANMASVATNVSYVLKQPTTATNVNYTYTDPNPKTTGGYYTGITNQKLTKGYGATVYSVALLGTTTPGAQTARFLNLTSSNYPSKSVNNGFNFSSGEGDEEPHDYYQLSSGSDLNSIFTRIAQASSEAEYNLSETSMVVLDVMSSYFRLPDGTDPDDIDVYTANYLGDDEDGERMFVAEEDWDKQEVGEGKDVQIVVDGKEVSVTGFDFAGNFVGSRKAPNSSELVPGGKELIIQIRIEVDPENEGGATLFTNDARSGIYVYNEETQKNESVAFFESPTLSLPNIIIRAFGLSAGESASYTVYKVQTTVDTESITEKGDYHFAGKYKDDVYDPTFTPLHVILTKTTAKEPTAKIKLNQEGRYKVVEDTWAYTYLLTLQDDYGTHDVDGRRDPDEYSDENTTKLYNGNAIVRTICLGTEAHVNDDPETAEIAPFAGDGTLFDFIHERAAGTQGTHRGESARSNWKTPMNAGGNQGVEDGGQSSEHPIE